MTTRLLSNLPLEAKKLLILLCHYYLLKANGGFRLWPSFQVETVVAGASTIQSATDDDQSDVDALCVRTLFERLRPAVAIGTSKAPGQFSIALLFAVIETASYLIVDPVDRVTPRFHIEGTQ